MSICENANNCILKEWFWLQSFLIYWSDNCRYATPCRENLQRLGVQPIERLSPLGIMRVQFRALLEPPKHYGKYGTECLVPRPNSGTIPNMVPRLGREVWPSRMVGENNASLSQCKWPAKMRPRGHHCIKLAVAPKFTTPRDVCNGKTFPTNVFGLVLMRIFSRIFPWV